MTETEPTVRKGRCHATAKNSGRRCTQPAIRGATVCRLHGGSSPQVRRAAARRVALAEAAAKGDRRHPGAILLDCLHALDTNMRSVLDDSTASAQVMLEAIEQAATLARDVVRLRVDEQALALQAQRIEQDQAELTAAALRVALVAAGFDRAQQDRALAELAAVLVRVDGDPEATKALLRQSRRQNQPAPLPALLPGEPT